MFNTAKNVSEELRKFAQPKKAKLMQGFFKTKKGEYGHGDIFLGITVPNTRIVAKKFSGLPNEEIILLLKSKIHEERLVALIMLVHNFSTGTKSDQKNVFEFYLKHMRNVNNWDLVDLSADKIMGEYLLDKPRDILYKLAQSNSMWERRISIISTFAFIKHGQCEDAFKIAEMLLFDKEDLIQKAVGWMLREAGKRCSENAEKSFLKKYYKTMPRTALRYAIERFNEKTRKAFLNGSI